MICTECMKPVGQLGIDDYSDELRTFRRCHECHYWLQAAAKQAAGTLFVFSEPAGPTAYRPSNMAGAVPVTFHSDGLREFADRTGTLRLLRLDVVPERFRSKLVVNAKIVEGVTA